MVKKIKSFINKAVSTLSPDMWKSYSELTYWKKRKKDEGKLANHHYSFFYTDHFNLSLGDYSNKNILDIGCGPRGSLEWATNAAERVGMDPLAKQYLKLGASDHQMQYVASASENIPFPDAHFDFTCSFNSLDHVENVEKSIAEIKRVTKPGGYFLMLVEINHEPTNCEPHELKPNIIEKFKPEFECDTLRVYPGINGGLYNSIEASNPVSDPHKYQEAGWLSAKFKKL